MAHILDGVLTTPLLVTGGIVGAAGILYGLKKLPVDRIPETGLMAATFFVASLVHFPVGPASVHLILNGLVGVVLGWAAAPAILIALFLQVILFGFGGLSTLGVNLVNMALPALLCGGFFHLAARSGNHKISIIAAGLGGALGVFLTALMVVLSLYLSGYPFWSTMLLVIPPHAPVMAIEAMVTATCVGFLLRVKPEMLRLEIRRSCPNPS